MVVTQKDHDDLQRELDVNLAKISVLIESLEKQFETQSNRIDETSRLPLVLMSIIFGIASIIGGLAVYFVLPPLKEADLHFEREIEKLNTSSSVTTERLRIVEERLAKISDEMALHHRNEKQQ